MPFGASSSAFGCPGAGGGTLGMGDPDKGLVGPRHHERVSSCSRSQREAVFFFRDALLRIPGRSRETRWRSPHSGAASSAPNHRRIARHDGVTSEAVRKETAKNGPRRRAGRSREGA